MTKLLVIIFILQLTLGLNARAMSITPSKATVDSHDTKHLQTDGNASEKVLTFGIVPQQSSTELASKWSGLIDFLSSETGHEIQFVTAPNIPEFERRLSQQLYDIAYMNPYHYVNYSQDAQYTAIAKEANRSLKGIIVVNSEQDIASLDELNNQRIAFPAPHAFAASMIVQYELQQRGIRFKPVYVRSHDSVYMNVNKGFFIAGGGIQRTLQTAPLKTKQNLRVLFESKGYTPHAFAVSTALKRDVALALQQALVNSSQTEQLIDVGMKRIEAAKDSDWDSVRELLNNDKTLIKN